MKAVLTVFCVLLLVFGTTLAAKPDKSSPSGLTTMTTTYTVNVDPTGVFHPWIDATGGTIIPGGDDTYAQIPWPFDFQVYDNVYTAGADLIDVNTNGSLHFDQGGPRTLWVNCGDVPSTIDGEWVAALGDDLYSWDIYYTVMGTAPYRVLAIEWVGATEYSGGGVFNLEILLYETTHVIVTQVEVVVQGEFASDGVVGINAGDALRGQEVICAANGGLPSLLFDVEFLPPDPVGVDRTTWGGVKALYR